MPIKLRQRHLNNASKIHEAFKEAMHEWVEEGSIEEDKPEIVDFIAAAIAQAEHFMVEDAVSSLEDIREGVPAGHRLMGGPVDGILTKRLCDAVTEMLRSLQDGPDDDVVGQLEDCDHGEE